MKKERFAGKDESTQFWKKKIKKNKETVRLFFRPIITMN